MCSPTTSFRVFVVATSVFGDGPPSEAMLISEQAIINKPLSYNSHILMTTQMQSITLLKLTLISLRQTLLSVPF